MAGDVDIARVEALIEMMRTRHVRALHVGEIKIVLDPAPLVVAPRETTQADLVREELKNDPKARIRARARRTFGRDLSDAVLDELEPLLA